MIFLNTSETLARIGRALPPGHRLLSLALELAAMAGSGGMASHGGEAETTRRLFLPDKTASGWQGEVGVLGAPGAPGNPGRSPGGQAASYLLWLGPAVEAPGRQADVSASSKLSPRLRQLVLNPPPGRYRIEYWDTSDCRLAGVEIGTASPLVLGPPDCGAALIICIISLL